MPVLTNGFSKVFEFARDEMRFREIYRKYRAFTMIPESIYVGNLRLAARSAKIQGCVVECGTWRGGMIAGIGDVLGSGRRYYLFDSFEGLPQAREVDGAAAIAWQSDTTSPTYYENCRASEEEARQAMSKSVANDYRIVKGWFNDILPKVRLSEPIALLRLDADWYDSTMCILENFAPCLAAHGMIIVDDYYTWEGCRKAVDEYAAPRMWRIRRTAYPRICYIAV